jgi:phage FluMu protein Com
MEEGEIILIYKKTEFPGILGIKCPRCEVGYLLEQFVMEQLREGEQMLDSK